MEDDTTEHQEESKPHQSKKKSQVQFVKVRNNRINIRYSNQSTPHEANPNICKELLEKSLENYKELIRKIKYDLPVNQEFFEPQQMYKVYWQSELTLEKVNAIKENLTEGIKMKLKDIPDLLEERHECSQQGNEGEINSVGETQKVSEDTDKKSFHLKLPGNILRKRKIGNNKGKGYPLLPTEIIDLDPDCTDLTEPDITKSEIITSSTQPISTDIASKVVKSTFHPPRHVPSLAEQLNYHPIEAPAISSTSSLKKFHESQRETNSTNTASRILTKSTGKKLVKDYEEEYIPPKERGKRLKANNCYRNKFRRKYESESSEEEEIAPTAPSTNSLFVSALGKMPVSKQQNLSDVNQSQKLFCNRSGLSSKFVPPISRNGTIEDYQFGKNTHAKQDEYLKALDPKLAEMIMMEIVDNGPPVHWDDIAGLEFAKGTIKEIVVWPMLRPDIFTGLRGPPKGILLFGPPGTGKTLIGKCIASQAGATFFSISASSLTSKWVGEGEKMVRALFTIAKHHQPAVIFIDEIDSLLTQRSDNEHESSRRIKTEFLVQLDGATTQSEDRILVVGATNRPQEIDEAARRRLSKRLYIPLPDQIGRRAITLRLMSEQSHSLTEQDFIGIVERTLGFSGADMTNLCREAALGPIRSLDVADIFQVSKEQVRPINYEDFISALSLVKPSVSDTDLDVYIQWNDKFGCASVPRIS